MKYYLVNYMILQDKNIIRSASIPVSIHDFASVEILKTYISANAEKETDLDNIVIRSYNQLSEEDFETELSAHLH